MTFEELLDQAIDMLRRRGRVTYRAPQLQFQLDDDSLDVLKDELLYGQQLAVDEAGRVLVWAGPPAMLPTASSPPLVTQDVSPAPASSVEDGLATTAVRVPQLPDAERRQLTVMFCDLVDSTALASQLDPEDLREVIRAYQAVCAEVIQRFDGHIAQYLGDGLLVYFGYPQAHEDDAQRAVRTGLGIVEALHTLNNHLVQGQGVRLAVRVGMHTGLVVVGAMGGGGRQEQLALGETPNIAARLQSMALPDTVVISEATAHLIHGYFVCEPLGAQALKGVSQPLPVYQVLKESGAQTRLDAVAPTRLTPLVGRDEEVALVHRRWDQATMGMGQVVLISGEAGIGKSRLVQVLKDAVPAFYPPLTLTPQRQRQKTFDTLLAWLHAEAQRQPVLVIVEDLHWIDPSTLELLSLLIEQGATARLCLVLTCRPEFRPSWAMVAHLTPLTLRRFAPAQVKHLATHVAGDKALPPAVLHEVVRKTDGVPLFVEELTKMVLESGLLEEQEDRYTLHGPLPPLAIPATLHDALLARLDRLAAAKVVAQLGATIGRTFTYDVVQAVAPLDAATLQGALAQLVETDVVAQRGIPPQATYTFKHALIQDAAYQSLLRSTRQQYHQRIAQVLEVQFPETVETQPELLAHHYTEAGLGEPAVGYWQRAGERAGQRSAHAEAIAHCTQGLAVLQTLPQTPARTQCEITLQHTLGVSLIATRGYTAPEVERAYARARALCQEVGDALQLFPLLMGLFLFYVNRPDYQTAHTLGEQCLMLAQQAGDAEFLVQAHLALGVTWFWMGQLPQALTHLQQGTALYDPQHHHGLAWRYGQDPGVVCHSYTSWVLWQLGYSDQARTSSHDALTLAQELSHPLSLVYALDSAANFHYYPRDVEATQAQAEATIALATEHGFPFWWAAGMMWRGWALAIQGTEAESIAQIQQGLAARRAIGTASVPSTYLAGLAEAHGSAGQAEAGLHVLAEAFVAMTHTGARNDEAELYRLKGELLLRQAVLDEEQAEACFFQALDVARRQQAKSLELRAAMSLSRLWQQQGKRDEARALLAPIYGWFTEGFDTADLQEAKALLEELGI